MYLQVLCLLLKAYIPVYSTSLDKGLSTKKYILTDKDSLDRLSWKSRQYEFAITTSIVVNFVFSGV